MGSSVEPARDALLADARERARQLLEQAEEQARELIAQAQRDAEELIARAREEGFAAGRAQAAHDAGRERALARWEVLAAQRAVYDDTCRRSRTEVMAVRDEPGYPELLERLAAAASRELGHEHLVGEVISLRGEQAVVQAHEYTGGLAPRAPAWLGDGPLTAELGPGLIGGVFDGMLRRLSGMPERSVPGARAPTLDPDRRWHSEQGDSAWARRRARAVALLADADRVQAVAELVGVASLPDHERIVLLIGGLLREAVLQQSALSDNDAWCGPDKQAALLAMVLDLHDRALELIARGVPAARIEELDLSDAVRARDDVGPGDAAGVLAIADELLARLGGVG